MKEFNGIVEQASEEELADAAALADRTGMYSCPHTGVALAVLIKLIEQQKISKTEKVVVISTAHGLKFSEFKVGYHEKKLDGINCRYANQPALLEPSADKVREVLKGNLQRERNKQMNKRCRDRHACSLHRLFREDTLHLPHNFPVKNGSFEKTPV